MFKRLFAMVVVVMVMVISSTTVFANPMYYEDTADGKSRATEICRLTEEYSVLEAIYEEEAYSDGEVRCWYDSEKDLYCEQVYFTLYGKDRVGMYLQYYDYEYDEVKYGIVTVNGKHAMTITEDNPDGEYTAYGEQYRELLESV